MLKSWRFYVALGGCLVTGGPLFYLIVKGIVRNWDRFADTFNLFKPVFIFLGLFVLVMLFLFFLVMLFQLFSKDQEA